MELKPKSFELLDKATVDIIHKFSIQQKVKISGSAKYRGILYASDIDLTSDLSGRAEVLANILKMHFLINHYYPRYFLWILNVAWMIDWFMTKIR